MTCHFSITVCPCAPARVWSQQHSCVLVILLCSLSQLTYLSLVKTANLPAESCCFKLICSCWINCQMFALFSLVKIKWVVHGVMCCQLSRVINWALVSGLVLLLVLIFTNLSICSGESLAPVHLEQNSSEKSTNYSSTEWQLIRSVWFSGISWNKRWINLPWKWSAE